MVPHKYVVTLVVERHDLSTLELGVVGEQTTKKPADAVSEPCVETVQVQLRDVIRFAPVIREVLSGHNVRHLEIGCRARRDMPFLLTQMGHCHSVALFRLFTQDHQVSKVPVGRKRTNLLHRIRFAWVEKELWDEHLQVGDEKEELLGRPRSCRD